MSVGEQLDTRPRSADEPPPARRAEARLSRPALLSLTAAVFAWGLLLFAGMPAPLPAGAAMVLALFARCAIRRRPGRWAGRGLAVAGLWIAVIHLVLTVPLLAVGKLGA